MALPVLQLVSNFKQVPNAAAFRGDNLDYEAPLKLCNSFMSDTRSKKMSENSHIGVSYSWAGNAIKHLSKLSIYQYYINGVFTLRCLKKNVFTIITKDNIGKNARSSTASSQYHEISNTVMQFPKADIPGGNLTIHPIKEEDGYDLTSILSSCSIVPQVHHLKETLHPQAFTFQGTVDELLKSIDGWSGDPSN